MILPNFQGGDIPFQMLQSAWGGILNPFLSNPTLQNLILKNVSLVTGANVINHKLQRKLQGWSIVRQRSAATLYDNQDTNQTPDLTLVLVSSANVSIDLVVF